jgi:hypothetical protein
MGSINERITIQAGIGMNRDPISKITKQKALVERFKW